MISILITIIIVALILGVVVWIVQAIGLPEPFNKIVLVCVALVAIVYLLSLLTGNVPALKFG